MPIEFTPFLGILAGAVGTLLLIAIVIILIIRHKYRDRPTNPQPEPNMKSGIHREADSQEYLPMSKSSDPDVICANKFRGKFIPIKSTYSYTQSKKKLHALFENYPDDWRKLIG